MPLRVLGLVDFAGLVKRDRGPAIYKPVHRDWNVINEPRIRSAVDQMAACTKNE